VDIPHQAMLLQSILLKKNKYKHLVVNVEALDSFMDRMDQVIVLFAKEMGIISLLNQGEHIMQNVLTTMDVNCFKRKEQVQQLANVDVLNLHI
jgi:ribosome recycling factor